MAALVRGSSTIRTSVSADIFDAKTDAARHHERASDENGKNYVSRKITLTPSCAGIYKVATITLRMSILFDQLVDIKVGYFGHFEFVDRQRYHRETFGNDPMIFSDNPTKQEKTMT